MEAGLSGFTGLKYEALKDFISWNYDQAYDLEEIQKEFIPLFLKLGVHLANEINSNRK